MTVGETGGSGGSAWGIAGGRYEATFGFVPPGGSFSGALTCRSLLRSGVELLAGPGAPLVLPWMGRLSSVAFEVAGERVDLADQPALTLDDGGRPLHGLPVAPECWVVRPTGTSGLVATVEPDFGSAFPPGQRVRVEASVSDDGLVVRTILEATGSVAVPAALGWHPYLRAPGANPDAAPEATGVEVFVPFTVACELEDLLPTGVERAVVPGWARDPVLDHHWRASPGDETVVRSGEFAVRLSFGVGFGWAQTWVPTTAAGFVCVEPMAAPLDPFRPGAGTSLAAPGRPWVGEWAIG